ncbi:glycoside hydrolase family 2 protein [Massilia cavernae]|uniref:Glycoside hydrolase family 2 n=1 Tax=Massilia cavernae TaxID=2320864 RepID=A0A418Y7C6_9BURK|nr:glycoside hydrolase family 2 TIM barrel-domain containing protein [Massilia cavernae]RJG25071.1 glycoside hydrolase family 2 [Massilia cavernae]
MSDFAYPRPQLVRDSWMCLNGRWKFTFDDERRYSMPRGGHVWTHDIDVPFAPESAASGIGDTGYHRICWYQREFELLPGDKHTILHFGAVDYKARVWVNGVMVGEHEGGHTPFSADITHALSPGGKQVVTVYAEDDPHDLAKPRGKQDWLPEPHAVWYPRTTGIWQTVWLEQVAQTRIHSLRWTPIFDTYEIGWSVSAIGDIEDGLFVEIKIRHGDLLLAEDNYMLIGHEASRKIAISDPGIDDSRNELLWSPERPTLLDAEVTLRHRGQVLDRVTSYTALRSVTVNRDRFLLNGRTYPLRMVLDQGYWPDTLMTAPNDDALRRDVELAKEMGFNGVRKHQKIEDPRYLYWADKLGLLVWEEMPSGYRFSARAIERMVREWTEAIERDYSHPCVIVWVPFNESWGVPNLTSTQAHRNAVEALYHLTRTLDATRPVLGNDGWEASATDILGIHDYCSDPDALHARYAVHGPVGALFDQRRPGGRILTLDGFPHRGQPVVLTQFGGVACDCDPVQARPTWGYAHANSPEEFIALYRRLLDAVGGATMFSGFCYTQFADTFQEATGLLRADRTPKVPIEQIYQATIRANCGVQRPEEVPEPEPGPEPLPDDI